MLDFSLIYTSILNSLLDAWYIIPIIILVLFFKSAYLKGVVGEIFVNIILKMRLDKKKYHLIKNVTLPTKDGTTQIDHIIVSEFGIFVIETKNMKGWIYGNVKQKVWTQKIYKNTSKFQNPLHQNFKHTKTIESLLGIDSSKIFSLVVFVGDSTFKTKMPNNVIYINQLISYIKSKTDKIIAFSEVNKIVSLIEEGRLARTFKTNREHVKYIQNK